MKLFIDAGNTRIKWGVRAQGAWLAQGALAHAEAARLAELLPPGAIDMAWGVNVAGPALAERLAGVLAGRGIAHPLWLSASAQALDVRNGYAQPGRLGADRWAALIGARG
ncbi:MAG: type III pantothenate kinase, partial [Zoogloea sp.]|nr:type III pantothenate kinase [Zoogloea sp.]